jgi:hypothetical protein
MTRLPLPLDQIAVASPCAASWEAMPGDDRVRFCPDCRLNVYNLSAMTRPEAEALAARREGRLCVRFYRRADDTVLTQDCPRGLAAVRAALWRGGALFLGRTAAMGLLLGGLVGVWTPTRGQGGGPPGPIRTLAGWVRGGGTPPTVQGSLTPPSGQPVMGDICPVEPNPGAPTPPPGEGGPDGK